MVETQVKVERTPQSIDCENAVEAILEFAEEREDTKDQGKLLDKMCGLYCEWAQNSSDSMSWRDWCDNQAEALEKKITPLLKVHTGHHMKPEIVEKYLADCMPNRLRDIAHIYVGLNSINANIAKREGRRKKTALAATASTIAAEHRKLSNK